MSFAAGVERVNRPHIVSGTPDVTVTVLKLAANNVQHTVLTNRIVLVLQIVGRQDVGKGVERSVVTALFTGNES